MIIRHFFIVCLLVITNTLHSKITRKISLSDTPRTYFTSNYLLKYPSSLSFLIDYQPRINMDVKPFFVKSTRGYNINWQKMVYKPTKWLNIGLKLSLSRILEKSEISQLNNSVFKENKFEFTSKLIILHLGIVAEATIKKYQFLLSMNYGKFFDGELSYKYHYVFQEMANCQFGDFNYSQNYSTKRSFPIRLETGISRQLYKRSKLIISIYNNEFSTKFNQSYNFNFCSIHESNQNISNANKFGFKVGLSYMIK